MEECEWEKAADLMIKINKLSKHLDYLTLLMKAKRRILRIPAESFQG